jgi:VCBS repeat-containing protein
VAEDGVLTDNVLTNDTDPDAGDTLTATLVTGPANGTLVFNSDGSFTYTPAPNFCGADGFTYQVNDGDVDSNVASVTIEVTCVNDAPVAVDDVNATAEDTPVSGSVAANDTDADNATLTYGDASDPPNGSVTLNADGSYTYTPAPNFCGTDTFTYTVSDGSLSDTGAVTITVVCVNDAPVAVDDAYAVQWNTVLIVPAPGVKANDADIDSPVVSAILVTPPSHGTVILNADGSFIYTPVGNYSGADSFTYRLNDGLADSNVATVAITVNSPCIVIKKKKHTHHDRGDGDDHDKGRHDDDDDDDDDDDNTIVICKPGTPRTEPDEYSVKRNTTLTVSASKGVRKNDGWWPTTVELWSGPSHGTLTLNPDGSFVYVPAPGFTGTDTFYYVARGVIGDIASAIERVTIRVTGRGRGDDRDDDDDDDDDDRDHRDDDHDRHDRDKQRYGKWN